jgi:hypothetical protein
VRSKRDGGATAIGGVVGVLAVFTLIVAPTLRARSEAGAKDAGLAQAEAAGCDTSQPEVSMNVGTFDYVVTEGEPIGSPTVDEAVRAFSTSLAEDGVTFSDDAIAQAIAAAPADADPVEIRLPGALLTVRQASDRTDFVAGFIVSLLTLACAAGECLCPRPLHLVRPARMGRSPGHQLQDRQLYPRGRRFSVREPDPRWR